ncbi:A/G-specific adenine glycosylase [Infirmifilum lucidum]|uniref:thymine-DNA glycosylase n=1 Tax=Infirmifilum lucidum TaxID=2776706 RepID=A0A7L9FGW5_9CREN|nr:A/G-specific adenine glycosylase [Infirmifilum lucidum]QOJ78871.1 A/G-specific adenine glycosylase [Infirmifilum lucidum]
MEAGLEDIGRIVIEWEKAHWIPYPWRVNRTPYRVLVAEVLLKRTTRQAVAREFPKFIAKFPDIHALYRAPIEEVEEALLHLGLYRQRARQLKEISKVVVEVYGGRIPDDWDALVGIEGIGVYIAGAVLSFGYRKRAPVVDSNVIRLFSRLTGKRYTRAEDMLPLLWGVVPERDHDIFNYGVIDLGAMVCTYRGSRCWECPLAGFCTTARQTGFMRDF